MTVNRFDDAPNRTGPLIPRLTSSVKTVDGRQVVNVENYVPYFLSAINNALSRGASKRYLDEFGIGIVEWRIMSMLAIEPNISATRICEVVALEKSSASRGLKSLDSKALLDSDETKGDTRRKIWRLNVAGAALHDKILAVALERERRLLAGIDGADLEIALRVMRQMRQNVEYLDI
jgi:DNA-binding MarR family transcriptional regulator